MTDTKTETPAALYARNQSFLHSISERGLEKNAAEGVLEYTRKRIREHGVLRRLWDGQAPTREMMSRTVASELPVVVVDFEPDAPGGQQLSVNGTPGMRYMRTTKYEVRPTLYTTPRFQKNALEMSMYTLDLRQIFADNSVKDLMAREDRDLLATIGTTIGTEGSTVTSTGSIQNQVLSGGITRDTMPRSLQIIPKTGATVDFALYNDVILMNVVTVYEFLKWGRDETGGDEAERVWKDGIKLVTLFKTKVVLTNKRQLVADNVLYFLAPEKFRGKFFTFEDATLYLNRDRRMFTMQADEIIGLTLANDAAFARARITAG